MTTRSLERLLWTAAALALGATGLALRRETARAHVPQPTVPPLLGMTRQPTRDTLSLLSARIVAGDPFRLARRPPAVAYGATPAPGAAAAPVSPRPTLTVSGIVGGPPWAALLDGVPGRDGSILVHAGDTLAGLRVLRISQITVTLTGRDTTWHLTLNHPWH